MNVICISTLILSFNLAICDDARSAALSCSVQADTALPKLRIALVGFTRAKSGTDSRAIETALTGVLARDQRTVLVDQSMIHPALTGIGYDGSINLSKDEARQLAAAIGCDFFIIGKTEVFARSEHEGESRQQAYAAVMIVDGRTGALADFEFISEKAVTREFALNAVTKTLERRASELVDRITQIRAQVLPQSAGRSSAGFGLIEDIPAEDSPRAVGFKPPEFLNRVKPEYTSQAELADITATVEAMAVFRSNGEVGAVEITRWAGFRLDESATAAIRQLKFKPATREGKPINVRALIRYIFRQVSEPGATPNTPPPEQPDKPQRDLRLLFKRTLPRPHSDW
jgi:TonB family protein